MSDLHPHGYPADEPQPGGRRTKVVRVLVLAAAAVGAILLMLALRRGGEQEPRSVPGVGAGEKAARPPGLTAGPTRRNSSAAGTAPTPAAARAAADPNAPSPPDPGVAVAPAGGEVAPAPAAGEDSLPAVVGPDEGNAEVVLRMEMRTADGEFEPIEIAEVYVKGNTWRGDDVKGRRFRVRPGWLVNLITDDPRALVRIVHGVVPDPAPKEFVLHVPSRDNPAIQTVEVEVVDAKTGRPLADAVLESEVPSIGTVLADAEGRFRIGPTKSESGASVPGILTWFNRGATVHAPGHLSLLLRSHVWGSHREGAFDVEDLIDWEKTGRVRVPLEPLPQGVRERRLRVFFADGRPVAGAGVLCRAFPCGEKSNRAALEGLRRFAAGGEITFAMDTVAGLDLLVGGQPCTSLLLHVDRWPESVPRELRLPPLAEVRIEIEDAPDRAGYWDDAEDYVGPSRTLENGPIHPLEGDAEALAHVEARSLCLWTGMVPLGGNLEARRGAVEFLLPVGAKRTLRVEYGDERRRIDVAPTTSGPHPLRVKWANMRQR